MLEFYRLAEHNTRAAASFLRAEVELGLRFASIALSTNDQGRRIRSITNATVAYNTVVHFMDRVALNGEQARELTNGIERLKTKLVALGEKQWNINLRRLSDRIRVLAAKAEEFAVNSPASQEISELMKLELSEYFEREKNWPCGLVDRRSSEQK